MDIIFVNSINFTKSNSIPLGLLSLGTILKNQGFKVKILDFDYMFTNEEISFTDDINTTLSIICDFILEYNPKIVSFYTMCNSYPFTIKLAQILKERNNSIQILLGGPQATLTALNTLDSFTFIDAIGIGEGEENIVNLVNSILNKQNKDLLSGVAYRNKKDIIINSNLSLLENLDDLPYIDYDLLGNRKVEDNISIDVGRGCPFSCTFCSTSLFWKRKYRLKSHDRLIKEIQILKDRYGVKKFTFDHDMFTFNREKVIDFCKKILKENLNITWRCSARADSLDDELLYYMSKSGCVEIFSGIESGSQNIQNTINKRLDINLVYTSIMSLNKFNIKPTVSFMYGFYEETIEDLNYTLTLLFKLLKNNVSDIQLHKLMVMPGTKIYENLEDKLYLNECNLNTNIFENRYINDLVTLIKSKKELFSNFYEFDTKIRIEFNNLDTLVLLFVFIYPNFTISLSKIIDSYKDNYTKLYIDYRSFIEDLVCKINKKQYENINLEKEILPKLFFSCFEKIVNKYLDTVNNDEMFVKLYNFEKDVKDFKEFSNEIEKKVQYNFDVITYIKNTDKYLFDPNNNIYTIKLTRIDDNKIKVSRYI